MIPTLAQLAPEYRHLWETIEPRPGKAKALATVARRVLQGRARYETVAANAGVPWLFVGLTHLMESGCDFTRHLHNGDPLTHRTVQVPAGRPRRGQPPFTWEQSAGDALEGYRAAEWPLEKLCYELERYNGWGYRLHHANVRSPYLWSYTTHYSNGKFVSDGKWSDTAVSGQPGALAVLKTMVGLDPDIEDELGAHRVAHEAPHRAPAVAPDGVTVDDRPEPGAKAAPKPPALETRSRKMAILSVWQWIATLLGIGTGGTLQLSQLEATKSYASAIGLPQMIATVAGYGWHAAFGLLVGSLVLVSVVKQLHVLDYIAGRWTPSGEDK